MKVLIKNATLYDGYNPPYKADVATTGDKITFIDTDKTMKETDFDVVINADGKIVTAGFIDTHRHCDIKAIEDKNFGELELMQGITTTICGNCGLAPFPTTEKTSKQIYDFIEPCLGKSSYLSDKKLYWFSEYKDEIDKAGVRINVGSFVGIGAVKASIKGYDNTPFTSDEMKKAVDYIDNAMQNGAMGISMGIMYTPECFSTKQEMVTLASVLHKYNGVLTCHIRGEGDSLVSSVEEIIQIGKEARIAVNISHFKSTGLQNWGDKIHKAIKVIDKARSDGQCVTVDFYPYVAGATTLLSLLPPWYLKANMVDTMDNLSSELVRVQLKHDLKVKFDEWDNMVESIGFERIIISSVTLIKNKDIIGRNIKEAAIFREYNEYNITNFVCDLITEEEGKISIILMSMGQSDVDTVAKLPYSCLISDSLYGDTDMPHPRLYGSFAKFIRECVYERGIIDLQTAINKMTILPANRYGIEKRGSIRVGNYADINVFDPTKFKDKATFAQPKNMCEGMDFVLVNGKLAVDNGRVVKTEKNGGYIR